MDEICKNCVYKNIDKKTGEIIMGGVCMHCDDHADFLDVNSKEGKEELKKQKESEINRKKMEKFLKTTPIIINGVNDIDSLFKNLQQSIKALKKENEQLWKENKKLRDTKDFKKKLSSSDKWELMREFEKENNRIPLETLTRKEEEALREFTHKHYEKCKKGKNMGAVGYDEYIYTIAGTGLGSIIKVKCPICGEEVDITDTDKF